MLQYDIIVVGGGIVGATAALALAKNSALKIAVLEVDSRAMSGRVSAISLSSQRIFQNLEVWGEIERQGVSPYTRMQVWDEKGEGEIEFRCEEVQEQALGHIVADEYILASLLEKISHQSNIDFICPVHLVSLSNTEKFVEFMTEQQQLLRAKLVIAADGATSWVREQAQIELKSRDYQHTAIVGTVRTEFAHEATARQRFLTSGPLAFLPLTDPHSCSIVWSIAHDHAATLMSVNETEFCKKLTDAFAGRLGQVLEIKDRRAFPLRYRHAKNYVQQGLALIGDAAHTIHPMAGQGVNLGLLDAVTLSEVVLSAYEKNRNFASLATLRRYERWRKSDTVAMLTFIDGLKYLFSSDSGWLGTVRNAGMNLTNRLPFIRNFFVNYALGNREHLPVIARSE